MNMGRGLGKSGQDTQSRIMFIARRKRKFGIPTNEPLHELQLLARIVEQDIVIIFGRHGGDRKTVGVSEKTLVRLHLAILGLKEGPRLYEI